jgi:uncharacterized protein (DUF2336 family)
MAVAPSLIPGLDAIVKNGDPKRRADAARKISELFLAGAAQFRPAHVDLFDGILTGLVPYTETAARIELAERLSLIGNAPPALVNQMAREDEILVAGPLLRRSPVIVEPTLIEIARMKGQGHLLAMSERPKLAPGVTDVIVRRGDREVVRRVAGNAGAQFSQTGYSSLIKRAGGDGVLTRRRPARRSIRAAVEGSVGRLGRHRAPPPVRGGKTRQEGRDQSGDGRDHRRAEAVGNTPRFRAGPARDPQPASRRRVE